MAARGMDAFIESNGLRLAAHVARPAPTAAAGGSRPALILCHGFPAGPRGAATSAQTYPEFADRLAAEAGWFVLTFNFRGTGTSEGDFSLAGWLADLRAAIDHMVTTYDVSGVWLAGFSTGGSLAICAAGEDERVRGVASFSAPADFGWLAEDPAAFLAEAREIGVVRTADFPPDLAEWGRELREIRPTNLVGKIPPRPLLLVHGTRDDVVPVTDARALAEATDGRSELHIVAHASHRLRHDPRAVAILLGWLDRQLT